MARKKPYRNQCVFCGGQFFSSHCYRLYCGGLCRQRAHRARVQEHRKALPPAPAQQSLPLVVATKEDTREWNGTAITRRADGWVNATQMAKANGKHLPHYLANDRTAEYLQALSGSVGIPTDLLVAPVMTGPNAQRGTWIHPRLAVDLARWISPAFAVWMDGWFLDTIPAPAPHHLPAPAFATGKPIKIHAPSPEAACDAWREALDIIDGCMQASGDPRGMWAMIRQPDRVVHAQGHCLLWEHVPAPG